MNGVLLPALDGANPLAFLAAIGALEVAERGGLPGAKLSWVSDGVWRPVLHGPSSVDVLVDAVLKDHATWTDSGALALAYEKDGKRVADLKPPPDQFRPFLVGLLDASADGQRRDLDLAAAFAAEGGVDGSGQTKPTALHFTAGQQRFLEMALALRDGLTRAHVEEALVGPWRYESELPVLGWDVANDRAFAYRACDPSKEKKTGVPGADWLGLLGLASFPTAAVRGRTRTTGCSGSWKRGAFTWPLWDAPLSLPVVRSVVGLDIEGLPQPARDAAGIPVVFRARIRRSDQGGYGSFGPASVLP